MRISQEQELMIRLLTSDILHKCLKNMLENETLYFFPLAKSLSFAENQEAWLQVDVPCTKLPVSSDTRGT